MKSTKTPPPKPRPARVSALLAAPPAAERGSAAANGAPGRGRDALIRRAQAYLAKAAAAGEGEILELLRSWNIRNAPPLGNDELSACVASALINGTPRAAKTSKRKPSRRDETTGDELPEVELPGGEVTITATAETLGKLIAAQGTHYVRGGVVVRVTTDGHGLPTLAAVRPVELASDLERVASLVRTVPTKNGPVVKPSTCSESAAKLILAARSFVDALSPLHVMARCPVLTERRGELVEVAGYDRESGILAGGPPAEAVSLDDARRLLDDALSGFRFASAGDRSRALAAIITPALVLGGLLPGRAPVDLGEADQSQTGKGFRNKLTAAIYRCVPHAVNQRRGGVGGLEESFDRALIEGQTFIAFDNIRGRLDSQAIESFLTEDSYSARSAYCPVTIIDPRRVCVQFTSNQAEMTVDLANRSSCVRLLKQPDGFQYPTYPAGSILDHVRARQPQYLGAVFAVVRAWHAAGKPRTAETRHDFRAWAQTLDWIVQHLLGAGPLLDGHRETQQRMTTPAMGWLRAVVLAVARRGKVGDLLIAADLLEAIDSDGGIDVPGLPEGADLEDESTRAGVLRQIGRRLKQCFGQADRIELDGLAVERMTMPDDMYRQRHYYRVSQVDPRDDPRDTPAMTPAIFSETPAIPAMPPDIRARGGGGGPPLMDIVGASAGYGGVCGGDGGVMAGSAGASRGSPTPDPSANGREVIEIW